MKLAFYQSANHTQRAQRSWVGFLVCPRRYRAKLPSSVRPNLFAGD